MCRVLGGIRGLARLAVRDMPSPLLAVHTCGPIGMWWGVVWGARHADPSAFDGPVEATLAWLGAGLIQFAVLQAVLFGWLYADKRREDRQRDVDGRLRALEDGRGTELIELQRETNRLLKIIADAIAENSAMRARGP